MTNNQTRSLTISAILNSDIPVAALEGGRTFGYALMEPMLDIKVLEGTN